ncbi:MAG TPA: ABC transporter substrate-binding protein [Patescibacteria group bacterium]|nr:ABC transporter substrate-binding protein [Patescibacteria group bacterium]
MLKQATALSLMVILTAWDGASPTAAEGIKIAVGMAGGVNQVPALVAKAKGFFKEEGLDVDVRALPRGSVAVEGLGNGSLQFAETANATFFAAVAKGVPLYSVGISSRGYTGKLLVANKNAGLKTLADLKGKHLATQVGTGMHTVLLMLLEKNGLKESDFNITNLRVVDMPAAMASADNIDAVLGWEPSIQRIVQAGKGKVMLTSGQLQSMAGITYPFLVTSTAAYQKEHPDIVQKLMNGYAKADKYIAAHHNETVQIYLDEIQRRGANLSKEDIQIMLFDDVDRFGNAGFTAADMQDLSATMAYMEKKGLLKAKVDLEKNIDQSFGKKADAKADNK